MSFFVDNLSALSGISQYRRYLENDIYINRLSGSVKDPVNYQLLELRRAVGEHATSQEKNFNSLSENTKVQLQNLATTICGSLEEGFNQLSQELGEVNWRLNDINEGIIEINEGIGRMHSMLDWKTDVIIENQRISNFYLGNIISILKIPDSQKQRGYYVEQGMNFLQNAMDEGPKSDYYRDALEDLLKAKDIEEKDFFVLHKLGLIYLNSSTHLDAEKAAESFKSSIRYARALLKVAKNAKEILYDKEKTFSKERILIEMASALDYASRCYYITGNLSEAIDLIKQAHELFPGNPEYGFQLAKYLAANRNEHDAFEILKKVLEIDKYYSVKILTDEDFTSKAIIVEQLQNLLQNLISEASEKLRHLSSIIRSETLAKKRLMDLQDLFKEKTYLNARTVLTGLKKIDKWLIISYSYSYKDSGDSLTFSTGIQEHTEDRNLTIGDFILLESENGAKKDKFLKQDIVNREKAAINWKNHQERLTKERRKERMRLVMIILIPVLVILFLVIYSVFFETNSDRTQALPENTSVVAEKSNGTNSPEVIKNIQFASKNVEFPSGSIKWTSNAEQSFGEVLSLLSTDKYLTLTLRGNTDNQEKDPNGKLAYLRAEAIAKYFIKMGVEKKRITIISYGSGKPLRDNLSEESRSKNRRVELVVKNYH